MSIETVIISAATILLGWCFALWIRYLNRTHDTKKAQHERLAEVEKQLVVLSTQVSPLWAAVQKRISEDLHHPHPQFKEMDELLEKLEALTITLEERRRLEELLMQRSEDMSPEVDQSQRDSARLMAMVMSKVVAEAAAIAAVTSVVILPEVKAPPPGAGDNITPAH